MRLELLHIKSIPVGRDKELSVLGSSSPPRQKSTSHRSEARGGESGGLSLSDTPTLGVEC